MGRGEGGGGKERCGKGLGWMLSDGEGWGVMVRGGE